MYDDLNHNFNGCKTFFVNVCAIQTLMFLPSFVRPLFRPRVLLLAFTPVMVVLAFNYQWLSNILIRKFLTYADKLEIFELITFLVSFPRNIAILSCQTYNNYFQR